MLSDLVKNTPHYDTAVAGLNTGIKESVDMRQESEELLPIRGMDLAQSVAEATRLTGHLQKVVYGIKADESSVAARNSNLIKVDNQRDSTILKLVA